MRLLAIEEDAATRALLKALFHYHGEIAVDCVETGADALARLGGGGYSAVLLDTRLSDLDGTQLLDEMRFLAPELVGRTILLTSAPECTSGERVFAVIRKPFDVYDLVGTVQRCVGATN